MTKQRLTLRMMDKLVPNILHKKFAKEKAEIVAKIDAVYHRLYHMVYSDAQINFMKENSWMFIATSSVSMRGMLSEDFGFSQDISRANLSIYPSRIIQSEINELFFRDIPNRPYEYGYRNAIEITEVLHSIRYDSSHFFKWGMERLQDNRGIGEIFSALKTIQKESIILEKKVIAAAEKLYEFLKSVRYVEKIIEEFPQWTMYISDDIRTGGKVAKIPPTIDEIRKEFGK